LIICDDGDSLINEEKFHSTAIEYDQTALTFVFKSEGGIFNQASQYFYEDSILALLPLDSNEVGVVWSCNKKLKNYLLSLEEIDLVTILQERIKKIFNIEVPLKNRHAFDLRAKNLESIFNKRILLMGDAAHTIHPMAGQGFNLGLRDIQCFEKLIAEKSTMDFGARNFLRKYERMRARDVTQLSTLTTSISNILFENKSFIKKARNKLLLSSVSKLKSSKYFKNYLVKQAIL
jgi:2-octaprenyl-6-methoxyphenol hydroxylase